MATTRRGLMGILFRPRQAAATANHLLRYASPLQNPSLPLTRAYSTKLFVGGLSFRTTEDSLRTTFAAHGQVVDVKIVNDRESGRSKGFGFVTFQSEDEAENALNKMRGHILDGRMLRVDKASAPARPSFGSSPSSSFGGGSGAGFGGGSGGGFGGGAASSSPLPPISDDWGTLPSNTFGSPAVSSGTQASTIGSSTEQNSSFGSSSTNFGSTGPSSPFSSSSSSSSNFGSTATSSSFGSSASSSSNFGSTATSNFGAPISNDWGSIPSNTFGNPTSSTGNQATSSPFSSSGSSSSNFGNFSSNTFGQSSTLNSASSQPSNFGSSTFGSQTGSTNSSNFGSSGASLSGSTTVGSAASQTSNNTFDNSSFGSAAPQTNFFNSGSFGSAAQPSSFNNNTTTQTTSSANSTFGSSTFNNSSFGSATQSSTPVSSTSETTTVASVTQTSSTTVSNSAEPSPQSGSSSSGSHPLNSPALTSTGQFNFSSINFDSSSYRDADPPLPRRRLRPRAKPITQSSMNSPTSSLLDDKFRFGSSSENAFTAIPKPKGPVIDFGLLNIVADLAPGARPEGVFDIDIPEDLPELPPPEEKPKQKISPLTIFPLRSLPPTDLPYDTPEADNWSEIGKDPPKYDLSSLFPAMGEVLKKEKELHWDPYDFDDEAVLPPEDVVVEIDSDYDE